MNEDLKRKILGQFYVPGKQYHSPLPKDIEPFYCYVSDGGHSILSVLEQHYEPAKDNTQNLIPIPVKMALRLGDFDGSYLIIKGAKYSSELGLQFDPGEEEF